MSDMPPEQPLTMLQLNYCVASATMAYKDVSPLMIKTLLAVEGGQIGTVRKNTDKSLDMGPMQINTVHLNDVAKAHGFTAKDLIFDACKNIKVGAWLLSNHLKNAKGSYWLAMGNYHSKTADKRSTYLLKVAKAYSDLLVGIRNGKEAQAIGRTVNWGKNPEKSEAVPSLSLLEDILDGKVPLDHSPDHSLKVKQKRESKKEIIQSPKVVAIDNQRKSLRFLEDE